MRDLTRRESRMDRRLSVCCYSFVADGTLLVDTIVHLPARDECLLSITAFLPAEQIERFEARLRRGIIST
jgi:hypothetical protein